MKKLIVLYLLICSTVVLAQSVSPISSGGGGGGTVTSITAGTGITLTPNPIIGAGSVAITNTIVAGGPTGSATVAPIITYNAQGQLTVVSSATVTPAVGSITGLGANVATWLATPSSANLAAAVTDETGTAGNLVFSGGPTLTGTVIATGTISAFNLTLTTPFTNIGLVVGTTTITSGTTTRILYNNVGVLGEYTITGTGTVVAMQTAPTLLGMVAATGTISSTTLTAITGSFVTGITTNSNPLTITQTWNATTVSFDALLISITNPTVSLAPSYLIRTRNASTGADLFRVDRSGVAEVISATGEMLMSASVFQGYTGANNKVTISRANGLQVSSDLIWQFWSGTNIDSGSADTTVSRQAAGVIQFGTSAANSLGTISANNLTIGTAIINSGMTIDTAHTDATVCIDTTSKQLYFGSGALGICLGTSSARYKDSIRPLDIGLKQLMSLIPVKYYYKKGYVDNGKTEKYGLLAEDTINSIPKIVALDDKGRPNSIDMMGVIPVMIKAIQELKVDNDNLKVLIEQQRAAK